MYQTLECPFNYSQFTEECRYCDWIISDHNDINKHSNYRIKELDNWNEECRQTKVNQL